MEERYILMDSNYKEAKSGTMDEIYWFLKKKIEEKKQEETLNIHKNQSVMFQ